MNLLAAIRHYQARASRPVAVVMAIAWLGFATAPCQATQDFGHSGSSHHHSMPADDCGHCPATDSGTDVACPAVAAGCQTQGQALLERRDGEDPKPQSAPPPDPPGFNALAPDFGIPVHGRARPAPVPRASIQQFYCTYLK